LGQSKEALIIMVRLEGPGRSPSNAFQAIYAELLMKQFMELLNPVF
jgi:hypothetical protein